jgi:hypothetical protein
MKIRKALIIIFLLSAGLSFGQQQYYRVRADFSIKEKHTSGQSNLTMGSVFYDKFMKRIVYNVTFPEKQIWMFYDTNMYKITGKKVDRKPMIPGYVDFSIFNLSLNNNLINYGLQKSVYSIKSTVKEGDMVISTWVPKDEYKKLLGEVKISIKAGKLYGVLFYNAKGRLMGKQIFNTYFKVRGFEMPTEIIFFYYNEDGSEIHQIITFKNIKVNDFAEADFYNYPVPQ